METIFINNKWHRCYMSLMTKAKSAHKDGYTERHHIVPKSLGGEDREDNIVTLTAREHLVAHKLLVRAVVPPARQKALAALWAMAVLRKGNNRIKMSSREFARLREEYFATRRGIPLCAETRRKISEALMGIPMRPEVIAKRSATLKENLLSGKTIWYRPPLSDEAKRVRREKRSLSMTGKWEATAEKSKLTKAAWTVQFRQELSERLSRVNRGKKRTNEQRQRISDALTGRKLSAATKKKISDIQRGVKRSAVMEFTLEHIDGRQVQYLCKANELIDKTGAGIKYLYLSLQSGQFIKRGGGAGWRLISKKRITED